MGIFIEMTGDERKLWRSFQKIIAKEKETEQAMKKIGDAATTTEGKVGKLSQATERHAGATKGTQKALGEAGAAGDSAFGAGALAKVGAFATGMLSVRTIVAGVSAHIQEMRKATDAAVQSIEKLQGSRKALAGRSDSSKDYGALKSSAESLSMNFGLSQEAAYSLADSARAGGWESSLKPIALASATWAEADDLTSTASRLPKIPGWENLSPVQAVNLVAAADKAASNLNFKESSEYMIKAARGGSQAGATATETAAMVTVMSDLFGASTGDRISGFGGKLAQNKKLAGKGLMGGFDALQAMPEKERKKFLGDSLELNEVYSFLENRGGDVRAMEQFLAGEMAKSGTEQAPLAVRSRAYLEDPENAALFRKQVSAQKKELKIQKERGVIGLDEEAAKDDVRGRWSDEGAWWISRAIGEAGMYAMDAATDDPNKIRRIGGLWSNAAAPGSWSGELDAANRMGSNSEASIGKALEAASSKLDKAADKMLESVSSPKTAAQRAELGNHREN